MIICKYLITYNKYLSHKPDYERRRLNNWQFVSLFQWLKLVFVLIQQKKHLWEIAMIEQIKQRDEAIIIRLGFLEQI